jgi:hypothetical protein
MLLCSTHTSFAPLYRPLCVLLQALKLTLSFDTTHAEAFNNLGVLGSSSARICFPFPHSMKLNHH